MAHGGPSPGVVTLTFGHGASSLELPVRPPAQTRLPSLRILRHAAARGRTSARAAGPDAQGWYEIRQEPQPFSYPVADTGTTISGALGIKELLRIKQGDNESCEWQGERSGGFKRGDWDCAVYGAFRLTSTPETFIIEETVRASEGGKVIFERENRHT